MPASIITTNNSGGKSIFTQSEAASVPEYKLIDGTLSVFADLHHAPTVPVDFSEKSPNYDLAATEERIRTNSKIAGGPLTGVSFRRTDMAPNSSSPMHRTLSIDYGVLVAGRLELTLDSGEKRIMNVGDTIVQRATMHQWTNPSDTEYARMVWVMCPIEPLEVNGDELKEQWGPRG